MLVVSLSLSLSLSLRHSSPSLFEEARAQKIEIRMQAGHACVPVNNLQWTKREGAMTEDEPEFNNTHYNSSLVRMFLRLPYDDLSCPLRVPFIRRSRPLCFSVSFLTLLLLFMFIRAPRSLSLVLCLSRRSFLFCDALSFSVVRCPSFCLFSFLHWPVLSLPYLSLSYVRGMVVSLSLPQLLASF